VGGGVRCRISNEILNIDVYVLMLILLRGCLVTVVVSSCLRMSYFSHLVLVS
jgi:hypothetical protein